MRESLTGYEQAENKMSKSKLFEILDKFVLRFNVQEKLALKR